MKIKRLLACVALSMLAVTSTAAADPSPIYVIAGQYNAQRLQERGHFADSLQAADLNGKIISMGSGASQLAPHTTRPDWYPFDDGNAKTGELFQNLISAIDNAMADDADAYLDSILWFQGEQDAATAHYHDYERNLEQLAVGLRDTFGDDFTIYVVQLADNMPGATQAKWRDGWGPVMQAQAAVAEKYSFVRLIDPDDAVAKAGADFNGVTNSSIHYKDAGYRIIADAYATKLRILADSRAGKYGSAKFRGHFTVGHSGQDLFPDEYVWGSFHYSNVWPMAKPEEVRRYYQSGLAGTWLTPHRSFGSGAYQEAAEEFEAANPGETFSLGWGYNTMEGGVGLWQSTRFVGRGQKYLMGGVSHSFRNITNGGGQGAPGWHTLTGWAEDRGRYGVAQLSNRALFPLDMLNLESDTVNEMFGYGMYPLPLTEPMSTLDGTNTPTGNHNWTLFLNSKNFKGPLAFIQPTFWSRPTIDLPYLHGEKFDNNLLKNTRNAAMETFGFPSLHWTDSNGDIYYRLMDVYFPVDEVTETFSSTNGGNETRRIGTTFARLMGPNRGKWDEVENWFKGRAGAAPTTFSSGLSDIYVKNIGVFGDYNLPWRVSGTDAERAEGVTLTIDTQTFTSRIPDEDDLSENRLAWGDMATPVGENLVRLPRYWKWSVNANSVVPLEEHEVPVESGLHDVDSVDDMSEFADTRDHDSAPIITPLHPGYNSTTDLERAWKTPGPVHGPHHRALNDGSTVTFYWYRFNEQPSVINSGYPQEQRDIMQARVEMIHQHWSHTDEYFPNPNHPLASIDPALLVRPPSGLEVGYVPVVVNQQLTNEPLPDFPSINIEVPSGPTVATAFHNDSLSGISYELAAGNYQNFADYGISNDQISAVRVQPGYAVELFQHVYFRGRSVVITADSDPDLVRNAFNNTASSAMVYEYLGPDVATIYENENLDGASIKLPVGEYENVTALGLTNDQISAVKVETGYEVELFLHYKFRGGSVIINANSDPRTIAKTFNDRASSLVVRRNSVATPALSGVGHDGDGGPNTKVGSLSLSLLTGLFALFGWTHRRKFRVKRPRAC